jgi:DNA-binding response OmpR family regulator
VANIVAAMRILVVDDERTVRAALERVLRLDGFEVALACDGRQAVRSQVVAPADAVLLDVLLPGSTAWRFASACAMSATARRC